MQRQQPILGAWPFAALWRTTPRPAASEGEPVTTGAAATLASERRSLPNRLVVVALSAVVFGAWVLWPAQNAVPPPRILTMMAAPTLRCALTASAHRMSLAASAGSRRGSVRSRAGAPRFRSHNQSVGEDRNGHAGEVADPDSAPVSCGCRTWLDGDIQRVTCTHRSRDRSTAVEPFELARGKRQHRWRPASLACLISTNRGEPRPLLHTLRLATMLGDGSA